MPTTKKENFYFGSMMCVGMVIFMTSYNLITNDLIGKISWKGILLQLILGFIVALLLESFIVGPIAKKIALSLPFDKSNKVVFILSLSLCMVCGMVVCMSVFGLVSAYLANSLVGESLIYSYLSIVFKNFVFALPLQLLIIGPVVRFLFSKFVKGNVVKEAIPQ
ncbi:hypothetical protein ACK8P5_13660 [Paenibacillus sp. EC2-1]|uniref:hypothetical protein n=1 Tax=Paenibacillus sp. EC2-1 TaxID=3388665 RepID=UPI003BEF01A2